VALGGRPSLVAYVKQVLSRREFIYHLAVGDLRSQHLDSILGNLWHVLNPMLLIAVYYVIFGLLFARTDADLVASETTYIAFLSVGVFVFGFMQRCFTNGANSIVANMGLIRSLQFPRAVLPIATVTKEVLTFGTSFAVLVVVLLLAGEVPDVHWLAFPAVFALMTVFGLGGALLTARLAEQVRDIKNVLPFAFRLAFYLSGVLFSIDQVVQGRPGLERLAELLLLNPFYVFVSLARAYLLAPASGPAPGLLWAAAIAWTMTFLVGGSLLFLSAEKRYGRG
jgi:teichoic acid transport system permease protein